MGETVEKISLSSWLTVLVDPVRLSILRSLCELQTATMADLRQRCHTSDSTIRRHLDSLESLELVREYRGKRDGLTPGRPARRYTLDNGTATRISELLEILNKPLVPTPSPDLQPLSDR